MATRAPSQVSLSALKGDRAQLVSTCDRLSLLAIQELWVLLPLVALAIEHSPKSHALSRLCPYLLTSVVCTVLMKWTLQGHPPQAPSLGGRLLGSLFRVATIVMMVALPSPSRYRSGWTCPCRWQPRWS
jgi:hypothetical protein